MRDPLANKLKGAAAPSLVTAALLLAACGSGGSEGSGPGGTTVVATTGVLADIARNVAGPDAEVVQLIPDGVDVHGFEASARDRQSLNDAALVVENGAGFEAGVPLDEVDAQRWALAGEGGELRPLAAEDTQDEGGEGGAGEEGDHGPADPHVWMDPSFVAAAVASLADALAEADPDSAEGYRSRAEEYADRLERLDAEIAEELSAIPEGRRSLATSHDALSYFADRYGLTVIATPFSSSGPEAEPSASRLAEVQRAIEESGVPAVFAQQSDSTGVLDAVARATGAEVVDELLVASPGVAGSYEEMIRRDAMLIAAALG